MPSKTIVDFANQVKSYALGIKDQQVLGAWNLLKYPYYDTTKSVSGLDYTDLGDGSVEADGTSTVSNNDFTCFSRGVMDYELEAGTYYASGCPKGGSESTYHLRISKNKVYNNPSQGFDDLGIDTGDGFSFTLTEKSQLGVAIRIGQTSINHLIFKPMISLEPNQPYVPYAMTNQELSEVKVVNASYTGESSTIKDISLDVQRVGKVVQFAIYFVTNASINAGATVELTLVNCPLPSYSGVRIIGFSGTYELIGWIESTGKVKIRFFGNTNANSSIVLTGTYLTND